MGVGRDLQPVILRRLHDGGEFLLGGAGEAAYRSQAVAGDPPPGEAGRDHADDAYGLTHHHRGADRDGVRPQRDVVHLPDGRTVRAAAFPISIDSAGLATLELEVLHRSFDTNFLGALGCCQAVLPFMLAAGHGRIVNVSSDHGSFPKLAAGNPGYRLSKTALNTLTVILADEVKEINVLVNAMTLGGSCEDPGAVASAAETAAWLATLPDDGPRGRFFRDRAEISW